MLPHVRPLTPSDLPAARALWAETDGVELCQGDHPDELARYLQRNPGTSMAALEGGRLVGAVLAGHDGRRGFLYHLAISQDRRRAGLGKTLIEHALAALKAAGVVRVLLLVASDNLAGQTFWARQGWEPLTSAQAMGRDL
jgi:ribosomal protein S18 acetylase RimI-like enzyme